MTATVPDGFEPAELGSGYGRASGPVWIDRAGHRMRFCVAEQHVNPVGTLHGGARATFADTQLIVFRAVAEEGQTHSPTISLSLDYLAPAAIGAWVEAAATLIRQTHTMLFTQAIMTVDGEPVARLSAI